MRLPVIPARRPARIGALLLAGALGLMLAACADDSDDLAAGNTNSAFSQALFRDYSDLSTQAAALPAPAAAEDDGFFSMFDIFGDDDASDNVAAKLFAAKAELAQSGQEPAPEAAPDATSSGLRARLVRDIDAGKTQFPDMAAAAQTQFDCWVVYTGMPGQAAPAAACRGQVDTILARLEASLRPVAPPPPPPAPVTAAPIAAPAAPADFTVYFNFDSWTLSAEDLTVLTNVIDTARAGGQAHITVVGHTDTSGSADYNQKLSVHRANVVTEALVDMGARRAAIQVSGVGETDLAVATPDGVKEAKNRRAVIGLLP